MATENLKVKITADASQAKAEIGKFKDALKGATQTGDIATKAIGKTTIALAGVAVALKAVKSAIKNAVDVAATGDAIKDNAQKVFMSTTAYQEWGYVLKQNGVEMSTLKTGMRQFAQQVANGSSALQKYGITATDVDTAFSQAISTIQNMGTETEKIAAATEMFGSRALELFPVLNMTNAETQSLMDTYRAIGGTMSNELIAASDLCSDSITAMKAAWGGLRNLLATYFLPIITKVVQWITLAVAKIRILLSVLFGVKETFGGKGGSNKKGSIAGSAASVAGNTGKTAKNLGKAAKNAKTLKRTLMGIDELSKLAEQATAAAAGGGGGGVGGISAGDLGGIGDVDSLISEETMTKLENFRKRVEEIKEGFTLIGQGIKDIFNGDWQKGLEKITEGIEKVFPFITTLKEKWGDLKDWVSNKIIEFKTSFTEGVKDKWNALKTWWDGLKVGAKEFVANFADKVTSAWNKVKKWWDNIKTSTKTLTVNFKFVDKLKSGWNAIAKKINAARNKSKVVKALVPYIPALAKGGVLTSPTTALMGEYPGARSNPEIATPQSLMYETMMKANGDMVAAQAAIGRQIIAAIENQNLTVKIGDETIARSAQRGNSAYYNRTGKALITL